MKTVYLIHGLNLFDDTAVSTNKLKPLLEAKKLKVVEIDYNGTKSLFWRKHNNTIAEDVQSRIEKAGKKPFAIIAHSNGADICERLMETLPTDLHPHNVVYLNPAISNNKKKPRGAFRQMIYHTEGDQVLLLGTLFGWKTLGRKGHKNPEDNQHNFNMNDIYEKKTKKKKKIKFGHKDFFKDKYLPMFFEHLWARMTRV